MGRDPRRPTLRSLALAAVALLVLGCQGDDSPSGPDGKPEVAHLLVVTHTAGFRHPSIPAAEQALADIAAQSGKFDVAYCRNAADVAAMLTPAALAGYDGVFFANTTGDIGIPDLPAFLAWIAAGHAFFGAHSASDTYHDAPAYLDMLGGEFETHGQQCQVDVTVEDPSDPSTAHLYPTFSILDEIYELKTNNRAGVHVLFSLPAHPPDGHSEAGQPGDFLLAWSKSYGSGRVFYTALGHREDVWTDPRFQQHLKGAIESRLVPGAGSARTSRRSGARRLEPGQRTGHATIAR